MFLEQAFRQLVAPGTPLKVLDLCAAPGGKSTHVQSLIGKESLLVSNEVIRSRGAVLKDNIIRWGTGNVVVTNNDPAHFSQLQDFFDIMVVDAPCSGSGLFRRDPAAMDEWSPANVKLCCQRQQRILADSWPALKKNGLLIYSTCSYSVEEDEEIMDWMMDHFQASAMPLQIPDDWGITAVHTARGAQGYRFWPDKVQGEGFFMACFRKQEGEAEPASYRLRNKPALAGKKELAAIREWVDPDGLDFVMHRQLVYAWPSVFREPFSLLLEKLKVIYAGTLTGELMRDKLVPGHALAMSPLQAGLHAAAEADEEQAIRYLQRKELSLTTAGKGWQLICFQGFPLGWINVLANRINNYYPKELRILKERNG